MIKTFSILIVITVCQWTMAQEEYLPECSNEVSINFNYTTLGSLDFNHLRLSGAYNSDKPSVGIEHIISEDKSLLLNFIVSN